MDDSEKALKFFEELLSIRTISFEGPQTGAYRKCADWLVQQTSRLSFRTSVLEVIPSKPVVIASWIGTEPDLPSVLLNSHYDVVPAVMEFWDTEPFTPTRKGGRIYARGTQDMKYMLALERLKRSGFQPRRSIHVTFVPDEEIGGGDGMSALLASQEFKGLNVGLALDEGIANPEDAYTFFYGERLPLWIRVRASGNAGHGSRFIPDTAVSKIISVAQKALEFRQEQEKRLGHNGGCKHATALKLGDVTTLNLTVLKAGMSLDGGNTYAFNVIPHEAEAGFDIRVPPSVPFEDIKKLLDEWTAEDGVTWEFAKEGSGNDTLLEHPITSIDRDTNPWYGVFSDSLSKRGVPLSPEVFPASTDARFVRALKIPAFGFSPLRKTPMLLHDHNEYVDESIFLEGIDVYVTLITDLASAAKFHTEA